MMPFFNTSQVPGVGSALTQPQVPAAGITPADPSQIGLWQKFQQKLQTDPNFKMALLTTGLNLLRTPQPGETGFDVFADASLAGVGTLDQLRQRDRSAGRETKQDELAERRVVAAETGVEQRGQQGTETISLGRDRLSESKRQFDERLKAGGFGPQGSGTTGSERETEALVGALMRTNPEDFPDRDTALLYVADLEGTRKGKDSIALRVLTRASELMEGNIFLPPDQQISSDQAISQTLAELTQVKEGLAGEAEGEVDLLEGKLAASPIEDKEGQMMKGTSPDTYFIQYSDGTVSGTLSASQASQAIELAKTRSNVGRGR